MSAGLSRLLILNEDLVEVVSECRVSEFEENPALSATLLDVCVEHYGLVRKGACPGAVDPPKMWVIKTCGLPCGALPQLKLKRVAVFVSTQRTLLALGCEVNASPGMRTVRAWCWRLRV